VAILVNALQLEDNSLYSALLANASFHELLLAFDRDLADTARGSGCTCAAVACIPLPISASRVASP
jgi:hypothetical protein